MLNQENEGNSEWLEHGFSCGSVGKEFACHASDLGSIPGLGRSPGEGKGHSLQYSGPENSMYYTVHRVPKTRTQLSNFHFHINLLLIALCVNLLWVVFSVLSENQKYIFILFILL